MQLKQFQCPDFSGYTCETLCEGGCNSIGLCQCVSSPDNIGEKSEVEVTPCPLTLAMHGPGQDDYLFGKCTCAGTGHFQYCILSVVHLYVLPIYKMSDHFMVL
jgi:hypothetical protein